MTNKVICISRQCGAGGRTIGEKLAKQLGIKCYHAEVIEQIAKQTGYADEFVRTQGENSMSNNPFVNSMNLSAMVDFNLPNAIVWKAQKEVVQSLAKEPCVIVGRCADYILKNNPDVLSVYIHAPFEDRMNRIVEKYGIEDPNPKKYVSLKDKRRTLFYEYFTDRKFGDVANYDICLNSSTVDFDTCVEAILKLC